MKKHNSKGFVLAETLIVTVFMMVIFTLIYSHFFPLVGEYEKRENYDDVDSKYAVYWLKRLIEDSSYDPRYNPADPSNPDQTKVNKLNGYGFMRFECKNVKTNEKNNLCKKMVNALEVSGCDTDGNNCDIFITHYRIGGGTPDFKVTIRNEVEKSVFNSSFSDYILYLPDYSAPSLNNAKYRVIARFQHRKDNNNYYTYSTIEVNR